MKNIRETGHAKLLQIQRGSELDLPSFLCIKHRNRRVMNGTSKESVSSKCRQSVVKTQKLTGCKKAKKEKCPKLGHFFGCGGRTWTYDLRVMSPTSYRLLYPATRCLLIIRHKKCFVKQISQKVENWLILIYIQKNRIYTCFDPNYSFSSIFNFQNKGRSKNPRFNCSTYWNLLNSFTIEIFVYNFIE